MKQYKIMDIDRGGSIQFRDFDNITGFEHIFNKLINILNNFNYDKYISIINTHDVNLKERIPEKELLQVPKYNLFKTNSLEVNEAIKKNNLIRKENLEIAQLNRQIDLENEQLLKNTPVLKTFKIYDEDEKKLINDLYLEINQHNTPSRLYALSAGDLFNQYIYQFLALMNQPIIIIDNDHELICRTYEVIDYEHAANTAKHNRQFIFNYIPYIKIKTDVKFKLIEDDDINYEALCHLDKINFNRLQQLIEPFITLKELRHSKHKISKFEHYQNNMKNYISPLLSTVNGVNAKINHELDKYNQEMMNHAENLNQIVYTMNNLPPLKYDNDESDKNKDLNSESKINHSQIIDMAKCK